MHFLQLGEFSNKAVASRRPGAKLQLQGQMVCRLGVVLLGPSNVKILGGEVEDLVERNSQVNKKSIYFFCMCYYETIILVPTMQYV